jgi:hypothetical protein
VIALGSTSGISTAAVEIVFGERERFLDARPPRHNTTVIARMRQP